MNASWMNDLADFLQTQSVGVVGESLLQGIAAILQGEAVVLVATGGFEDTAQSNGRPTIQVTSRFKSAATAWAKAFAVHGLLNKPRQRNLGTTRFLYSKALQPPFQIADPDPQFTRIVCNYRFELS